MLGDRLRGWGMTPSLTNWGQVQDQGPRQGVGTGTSDWGPGLGLGARTMVQRHRRPMTAIRAKALAEACSSELMRPKVDPSWLAISFWPPTASEENFAGKGLKENTVGRRFLVRTGGGGANRSLWPL